MAQDAQAVAITGAELLKQIQDEVRANQYFGQNFSNDGEGFAGGASSSSIRVAYPLQVLEMVGPVLNSSKEAPRLLDNCSITVVSYTYVNSVKTG